MKINSVIHDMKNFPLFPTDCIELMISNVTLVEEKQLNHLVENRKMQVYAFGCCTSYIGGFKGSDIIKCVVCLNNFSHLFVNACHGKFIFDLVEFLFDLDWYTTFFITYYFLVCTVYNENT